jgi:hypothetical protein
MVAPLTDVISNRAGLDRASSISGASRGRGCEHCLRWLDGQAEVAGIPADTIRAALASVARRTILAPFRRAHAIVSALAFS